MEKWFQPKRSQGQIVGLGDLSSVLDLPLGHCVLLPSLPLLNQCPHQGQSAGSPSFSPVLKSLWAFDVQVLSGHSNEVSWLGVEISSAFSSLGSAGIDGMV